MARPLLPAAGITLHSTDDILDNPRDGAPDLGAYEAGADGRIFADGFESGDRGAWSAAQGAAAAASTDLRPSIWGSRMSRT